MRVASVLVLLGSVGASGGGDGASFDAAPATTDIGGWYQVTSAEEGPCGALAPSALPPTHIFVEPFSGIFYVRYCSGPTEADCNATPFYDFTDPIADGWAAEGGSAFFSADCTLSWERTEATLAGTALEIHSLRYTEVQSIPQAECTLAAAAAITTCTGETAVTATAL
jgi:hypothetical protein